MHPMLRCCPRREEGCKAHPGDRSQAWPQSCSVASAAALIGLLEASRSVALGPPQHVEGGPEHKVLEHGHMDGWAALGICQKPAAVLRPGVQRLPACGVASSGCRALGRLVGERACMRPA